MKIFLVLQLAFYLFPLSNKLLTLTYSSFHPSRYCALKEENKVERVDVVNWDNEVIDSCLPFSNVQHTLSCLHLLFVLHFNLNQIYIT